MSDAERDRMRARLDEFSQRLDARTREFRETGQLSDLHQSLLRQIQGRHDRMQARLASVEAKGSAWDVIRVEIERDFGSIYDDLLLLDDHLDVSQMKQHRE
jgi:hypothetical protein